MYDRVTRSPFSVLTLQIEGWFRHLMGLALDGNGTKMPVQELPVGWETTCWGCGLRVVLPKFAPMFMCGWCGAITIDNPEMKPTPPWSRRCSKGQDRVFVFLVLCLTFSILEEFGLHSRFSSQQRRWGSMYSQSLPSFFRSALCSTIVWRPSEYPDHLQGPSMASTI